MSAVATNVHTANQWHTLVNDGLEKVEARMRHASKMGQSSLDAAVDIIISSGGKRMRPAITLLMGRHLEVDEDALISVAASVELLHTATLVHDDLIDGSPERRGAPTLHSQLSAGVTVLTGDFLFAQAAALAAEANSVAVVQLFSQTLVRICRGEILQAQTRFQVPTHDVYIERIYGKTAALFESAAQAAALLSNALETQITAISEYGRKLGLAFQIMDDALDFSSTTQKLGKPAGNDMRQGIFNLPVMYYVDHGKIAAEELIARVEGEHHLDELVADIQSAYVVEESLELARDYARQAMAELDVLGNSEHTEALRVIAEYAVARDF